MRLSIEHATSFHYDHRVMASTQVLRLTPRENSRQHILQWDLDLPVHASRMADAFGNVQHVLTIDGPHDMIRLTARGVVELDLRADEIENEPLNPLVFVRATPLTEADAAITDFADNFRAQKNSREQLRALAIAVADRVELTPGHHYAATKACDAFAQRRGGSQDQAHVFLACARAIGVPARYVSGYVHSETQGHIASHAWAEAWLNDRWLTFDIGHRLDRATTHLKLAVGLDYLDACPVRGVRFGGANERLEARAMPMPVPGQ